GIVGPKTWAAAEAEPAFGAPVVAAPSEPRSGRVATLQGADEATVRATIVQLAMMRAGLGAKSDPDRYARAIGCHRESAQYRRDYVPTRPQTNSNASCCGLGCRAILADAGCEHPLLGAPYIYATGAGGWVMGQLEHVATRYSGGIVRPRAYPDDMP